MRDDDRTSDEPRAREPSSWKEVSGKESTPPAIPSRSLRTTVSVSPFTWAISGSGGGGTCKVTYATQSQWAGGFVAGITIANTGSSPINGWTLKFTFPGDQKITNAWNGTETQSGEHVTITNAGYNGTIAPGGSTSLGFQGTWTSSDAVPAAFTVNGTACTA